MQRSDWERLRAPFSAEAVAWRIVQVASDQRSARVVPRLSIQSLVARLDEVCGPEGWSVRYRVDGAAVTCELSVGEAVRSAVTEPRSGESVGDVSKVAFAQAAELFGILPPLSAQDEQWVDFDAEEGRILAPELQTASEVVPESVPSTTSETTQNIIKPEAQQAIDRLVERLKSEGKGLETARLLVKFGGYGEDPQSARELYRQLRELLTAQLAREP